MFRQIINISTLDSAKKFVNLTAKYDGITMRLRVDDYEIDAHSIVGVLSIVDSESNAVFTANVPESNKDTNEALLEDIKPFIVKDQAV